uniref:Uncharacterized protein n=1 Tax=Lygus hesperus TaxID=30085 RepID=A0A146KPG5_LYGHE
MRISLLLICVFVAVQGAPRRSILGRLGAATTGIAIGSSATNMATGIASQSLGLAGQALGQIPFLGPLAQIGTSLGQTGIEAGNSFAQMGLGIGQAAVNSHAVGGVPVGVGVAQNIIQGLSEGTRAVVPAEEGVGPAPAQMPNAPDQQAAAVPNSQEGFGPQNGYDYYEEYSDAQDEWDSQEDDNSQQDTSNSRPPPPQPIYVGAK